MKNNILFYCLLALLLGNCSPKVADTAQQSAEKKANEVAEVMVGKEDFRKNVPAAGPPPKIQIGSYNEFQLDNGLKVIVVENHKLPRISYQLFVNTPDIMQNDKTGYIDMAGELLSKGTDSRTKAEIDEAIDFMGASLSTSSSGVFASSLTKHTSKLLEIMSDVLLQPSFPESEFAKIKKQTLSNLAQSKDDPNTIASNVGSVLRYGKNHPYGEITTEASLENITREDCKQYYETFFKPNISYLIVVGDVTMDKVKPMIEKHFASWKASRNIPSTEFTAPSMPAATSVDFVNKSGAVQSVISITYPVDLKPGHPDVIKSRVMNTMLGGFFQSRLNQNLRETNAYTYGARSRLSSDKLVGSFTAGASVRNEVTDSSLVQFMYELNKIRDEQIDQADLDMVKNVIAGNFARSLERPETVARFALNTARYNLPADYYATYLEKLSQVNLQDVQAMAQKYVKPANAHVVVVGNKDDVADKLSGFASNGKVDFYDHYFELLGYFIGSDPTTRKSADHVRTMRLHLTHLCNIITRCILDGAMRFFI
ncbi:MAG: pitrilysin family protein, partial [Bacteroidota bacterium]